MHGCGLAGGLPFALGVDGIIGVLIILGLVALIVKLVNKIRSRR